MNNMILAIVMGLYFWFANLRFEYTLSGMLKQPVCVAVVVGLLTGHMAEAMTIGAGIQLMFLGVTSTPGGNVPNDPALAGTIAIPIAVTLHMNAAAAVALAVPFGILGVFLDQLRRTINAVWIHMADKQADKLNYRGIYADAFIWPAIMGLIIRFPVVFAANYFGRGAVQAFINVIPQWLMHGFEVMGALLPALGFALTISVIGKKSLLPYFFIGFIAVVYFKAEIMAVAVIGFCIAYLVRKNANKEEEA